MLSHSRHIIPIPSQPVFALSPYCYVLSGEAINTNFIVFGLTRSRLEPTIYRTREHASHYTNDVGFVHTELDIYISITSIGPSHIHIFISRYKIDNGLTSSSHDYIEILTLPS
jgi:hypothetical protein